MNISEKHTFMQASSQMQEVIKPLIKFGITYFSYNKNYYDGSHIRLTTHSHHLYHFLQNQYYKIGNIDAHPKRYTEQIILYSALPNQFLVEWAEREFNIKDGIYFVRNGFNFTEFFGFATDSAKFSAHNFYINNISELERFCDNFRDQYSDLIEQAEKAKLYQIYNSNKIEIVSKIDASKIFNKQQKTNTLNNKLSKRQFEILNYLMQGFTVKMIAQQMLISPRTVEEHICILRRKFNAKNIVELVAKLAPKFTL